VPDRFQGVRGFTGLRNGHHQGAAVQHRVAVAEFAGELHFHRQPRPVLDRVFREQPGVIRGAAGDHEYLVDLAQFLVAQSLFVEHDPAVHEMPQQGVGHRGGLLGDLLEHEVLVAALFGGGQVPVDVKLAKLDVGVAIEIDNPVAVRVDHHGLVLAEFDRVAGVLDECGHVGAPAVSTGGRPRWCRAHRRWRTPG